MVYVFLANGFEETEAIAPIDLLRRAGADLKIVGIGSKTVESRRGIKIVVDIIEEEAVFNDLQMIVLPGGLPGAENLDKSTIVRSFINYAFKNKLYIGAICAAPSILGDGGFLKGKNCTCFPGFEDKLVGAIISNKSVCTDENLITAKGAGVSVEFGLELVRVLFGKDKSDDIKKSIQCR